MKVHDSLRQPDDTGLVWSTDLTDEEFQREHHQHDAGICLEVHRREECVWLAAPIRGAVATGRCGWLQVIQDRDRADVPVSVVPRWIQFPQRAVIELV